MIFNHQNQEAIFRQKFKTIDANKVTKKGMTSEDKQIGWMTVCLLLVKWFFTLMEYIEQYLRHTAKTKHEEVAAEVLSFSSQVVCMYQ